VTAAVATFRHFRQRELALAKSGRLGISTAFEWLQELTELSKRVASEKIEEEANVFSEP